MSAVTIERIVTPDNLKLVVDLDCMRKHLTT